MGPFEVRRDGSVIAAGGGRRRALLAALVVCANEPVSVGRLRELVWGDREPPSSANLIQGYVSDWRSLLEPGRAGRSSGSRLLSRPGGYELRLDPGEADTLRFATFVAQAQTALDLGDLGAARTAVSAALALRRGAALAEFGPGGFEPAAAAIEDDWVSALRLAVDVELRMDCPQRALALLERPMAERPLREDLVALGMRALYRLGRQGDALSLFGRTRRALAEELGVDPEPALAALHRRILLHDPALAASVATPRRSALAPVPVALSTFFGRDAELTAIIDLLRTHRLVTLTGVGGSGKTRLAIEIARAVMPASSVAASAGPAAAGAVVFVDAAALISVDLLWPAIAAAAGQHLIGTMAPLDALLVQLGQRRLTVVLDNLEHLPTAGIGLSRMLTYAGGVTVLATSRAPLGVPGEQLFGVGPLPVPAGDARDLNAVLASPSAQMFLDRARSADPSFEVTDDDAPVLAGIFRRLDGLPLALELAASWTRTLTPSGLFERLDRPMKILAAAPGSAWPARHRTMRSVIEWSYAALTRPERRLLSFLSVFESGARLDTLDEIAELGADLLPALTGLVRANLAQRVGPATITRVRLLQTVRDFALEQGPQTVDRQAARARHAQWFRDLAERTARASGTAAEGDLIVRMDEEQAEIRAALAYWNEVGACVDVLEFTVDCLPLWWELGHIEEGYRRVTAALVAVGRPSEGETQPPPAGPDLLVAAEIAAACLSEAGGRPLDALGHERNALAHARRAESPLLELLAREWHGNTVCWTDWHGDAEEGLRLLQSAAADSLRAPTAPQRWGWANQRVVWSVASLSMIDVLRYRDPPRARSLVVSIRDEAVRAEDSHLAAFAARAMGFLHADVGRYELGEEALSESLELAVRSGSPRNETRTLEELARLSWARARIDEADGFAERATQLSRDAGHALNWARCAALLADIRMFAGDLTGPTDLLDDAERAVSLGYPDLAMRTILPRRARLARLCGDLDRAAHYLHLARALEDAAGLSPDRVAYLVEAANAAAVGGDERRQRTLIDTMMSACDRLRLVAPEPELAYVGAVPLSRTPEKVQTLLAR